MKSLEELAAIRNRIAWTGAGSMAAAFERRQRSKKAAQAAKMASSRQRTGIGQRFCQKDIVLPPFPRHLIP